jgi:chitodextrinase
MSLRGTSRLGLLCVLLGLGLLGGGLVYGAGGDWHGVAEGTLCGPLSADVTLTLDQSPYSVTCDVTVNAGVTLEIEPGVEMRFGPDTALVVQGTMLALGTGGQPVVLTSGGSEPEPGDWARILAREGATVRPMLANCSIRHQVLHGIVVEAMPAGCDASLAEPTIVGCTVVGNGGCGVYGYGHGDPSSGCVPPVAGVVGGLVTTNGLQQNGSGGICLRTKREYNSGGEVRIAIEQNRILANGGHGIRLYGDDQDPIHPRIENNVIQGNGASGIDWEAVDGGWDLPVVNNTIVANGGAGIWSGGPASRMLVTNNIVAGNGGYGLFCASDEGPVCGSNDIWNNEAGAYGGCAPGTTDFTGNPLFVDQAAGDWALRFGSPCIDAGTANGAPATDIEGTARPQGDGFDVGAYEFTAPAIEVWSDGIPIPAGSEYDVGMVAVGSAVETGFAIGNLGSRRLAVEAIEIEPPGDYTLVLSEPLPLTVTPGNSTTFGVRFAPKLAGRQSATLLIESDDPDDSPYQFGVTGLGIQGLDELTVSGPVTGLIGSEYPFTVTVSPSMATQPITYTWLARGQLTQVHTGGLTDGVSYAWPMAGVQGITVTAENAAGAMTATRRITLYRPVRADFTATPRSGPVPLAVVFTNRSTGDFDRSWWDFGDQTTSTLPSPTHTFGMLGAHTITLRVTGPGGIDLESRPAYIDVSGLRLYLPVLARGLDQR